MSRPLTMRSATPEELDQLHRLLKQPLQPWQRRRLETVLLHTAGHTAVAIAALLGIHVNTVYSDLRLFHRRRLRGLLSRRRLGAPPRLTAGQRRTIWRLAEQSPTELGRPYGRWSLAKLRDYLISHHIVRRISREHLRRVLKKGGTRSDASSASCGARMPTAGVSCTGSGSCGRTGQGELSCCFSMSSRSPSRPTAVAASARNGWCSRAGRRPMGCSTCSWPTSTTRDGGCGASIRARVPGRSATSSRRSAAATARGSCGWLWIGIHPTRSSAREHAVSYAPWEFAGRACPKAIPTTTRWKPSSPMCSRWFWTPVPIPTQRSRGGGSAGTCRAATADPTAASASPTWRFLQNFGDKFLQPLCDATLNSRCPGRAVATCWQGG